MKQAHIVMKKYESTGSVVVVNVLSSKKKANQYLSHLQECAIPAAESWNMVIRSAFGNGITWDYRNTKYPQSSAMYWVETHEVL